jgi:hypothetical protein
MTPDLTRDCALGISEDTLSAWRDGLLPAAEMRRLDEHATTCPSCRARLDSFDAISRALRSQRPPDLRDRVWERTRWRIAHERTGRLILGRARLWQGTLGLAAAAVLVALFAGLLLSRAGQTDRTGSGIPVASMPATPHATATTVPTTTTTRGWRVAQGIGSGTLPYVAFAAADPSTAYACISDDTGAFAVSVSHDAGATWTHLGAPISGAFCYVSVNPTNPRDIVLVDNSSSGAFNLTRSFDGGATWHAQHAGTLAFQTLGWVDSTLYVANILTDNPVTSKTELWASVAGGPFVERDQNGQLSGMTLGNVTLIAGHGSTMFILNGSVPGGPTVMSTDGGATWTQADFHDGGHMVKLIAATPDGGLLAGLYSDSLTLALSHDDGKTWQRLAALPSAVTGLNNVLLAPDGTVYLTSGHLGSLQNPDNSIYTTTSTASQWSVAAILPANAYLITVAWDASGHPTTLWARQALDARGTAWQLIHDAVRPTN